MTRVTAHRSNRAGHAAHKDQLIRWVGSKFAMAGTIIDHLPPVRGRYIEPFLGAGGILTTLAPNAALAGDSLAPLVRMWRMVKDEPDALIAAYAERSRAFQDDPAAAYEQIKQRFNDAPNAPDLLVLARTAWGGLLRFRRSDGQMTTTFGRVQPIAPEEMGRRIRQISRAVARVDLFACDFAETMANARRGDVVYCDPPYLRAQRIIYGAHGFDYERLVQEIASAKARGATVALSMDASGSFDQVLERTGERRLFRRQVAIVRPRKLGARRPDAAGATDSVTELLYIT